MKFKLINKENIRIDMSFLSRINNENSEKIKKIKINHGNKIKAVKDLFTVTGNDSNKIEIVNSNDKLDNIGSGSHSKEFIIRGDVGYGVAKNMSGGNIIVYGNAGESACSGMAGGTVKIFGSAGNKFCCLPTGGNEGFIDGLIYVSKNVGDNSIIRMRRGNIIIGGNIGDNSCDEMIAGTVVILGRIGKSFGKNPKRATYIVKDSSITKDYIPANNTDGTFITFYIKSLESSPGIKIKSSKKISRYFGTKKNKNLVEVFTL